MQSARPTSFPSKKCGECLYNTSCVCMCWCIPCGLPCVCRALGQHKEFDDSIEQFWMSVGLVCCMVCDDKVLRTREKFELARGAAQTQQMQR